MSILIINWLHTVALFSKFAHDNSSSNVIDSVTMHVKDKAAVSYLIIVWLA